MEPALAELISICASKRALIQGQRGPGLAAQRRALSRHNRRPSPAVKCPRNQRLAGDEKCPADVWRAISPPAGASAFALLAVLICLRIWDPAPLEELRLRSFDLYQSISPRSSPVRPVVIVDIDEASIAALGQWPWPRTILADLLTRLDELQVAAVALRRGLPGARSLVTERGGEAFSRGRRCDPRAARCTCPATTRSSPRPSGKGAWWSGQSGTHAASARAPENSAADRLCHRRSRSRHAF